MGLPNWPNNVEKLVVLLNQCGNSSLCRTVRKKNMNPANPGMVIRNETDADIGVITEVTIVAFETLEISNHTEKFIIEALRAAKVLQYLWLRNWTAVSSVI